jgi:hypothetical protein
MNKNIVTNKDASFIKNKKITGADGGKEVNEKFIA